MKYDRCWASSALLPYFHLDKLRDSLPRWLQLDLMDNRGDFFSVIEPAHHGVKSGVAAIREFQLACSRINPNAFIPGTATPVRLLSVLVKLP